MKSPPMNDVTYSIYSVLGGNNDFHPVIKKVKTAKTNLHWTFTHKHVGAEQEHEQLILDKYNRFMSRFICTSVDITDNIITLIIFPK